MTFSVVLIIAIIVMVALLGYLYTINSPATGAGLVMVGIFGGLLIAERNKR